MDYSSLGSSVCGMSQATVLEWVAISFSRGSSQPRNWICINYVGRQNLYCQAIRESSNIHSVQFSSVAQSCPTLCDPMNLSTPGLPVHHHSRSLLKLMSIESVMPSSHLIFCRPLLLLPPIPPSIRVFSSESALHMRWPKYWSFSLSISPSNEHPGLVSFRMDWLDLLVDTNKYCLIWFIWGTKNCQIHRSRKNIANSRSQDRGHRGWREIWG